MILDGQVLGRPLISYKDTQTAIEALTGVVAGMTAYATDTALTGYYTGSAWVWLSVTSGSYVPIVHDITGAYHSTSGRTSGQVLQATGATTFGWSTNTLNLGNDTTLTGSGDLTASVVNGVYCIGDSITDTVYPPYLNTLIGSSWHVNSVGVSGNTTAQMYARYVPDVTGNSDARYVVILGGINDVASSYSAATIEANLQAMYTAAHNLGIKVVAAEILPFGGSAVWSAPKQAVLDAVNAWIASTAIHVDYIAHTYAALEDPGNPDNLLPAYDGGDHIHLTTAGAQALSATIYSATTWTPVTTARTLSWSADVSLNQNLLTTSSPTFRYLTINNTIAFYGAGTLGKTGAGALTLSSAGAYTLTVPATGTAALLQVANTFAIGPQTINTGADANKGIIAKANSATQTGNLIEVQNSSGTGLSAFSGAGNLRVGSATVRDSIGIESTKTFTSTAQDATTFYYYGMRTTASASPTGNTVSDWRTYGLDLTATAGNANNINGFIIGAQFAAQSGMTGGTLTTMYGGLFATNGINASGTGTTTTVNVARMQLGKSGAGTWSIGTAALLSIPKPSVSAGTLSGTTLYGVDIGDMNGANSGTWTNRYAVNSAGGRWVLANTADEVLMTLTGHTTQSATTTLAQFTRNDANTNAIATMLGLTVNTTGTAAAGFGGSIALNLESSTTADQAAAAIKWLWTDATHATRTSRADIETTGPGRCAAWGYNGVDGTARYIINNGAGDVTEGVTVQYVASEVTGTDSYGGVVYLEPSDSFAICTDGTNTLTIACASDGSLYVQRSSGTDTFKFSCWAVWQ